MSDMQTLLPFLSLKETINDLEGRLKAFKAAMQKSPSRMRVYAAYRIPFRGSFKVDADKAIEAIPLTGAEAVNAVIEGLTTIRIEQGVQHPCETLRIPGVIAMPDDWLREVEELNEVKASITEQIEAIEDKALRKRLWASDSSLSAIQTMRQNWVVSGPERIRLYWDSAPVIKRHRAGELMDSYTKLVTEYHGTIPRLDDLSDDSPIRKYVYALAVFNEHEIKPCERIAYFRTGQHHVRARVSFIEPKKAQIRPISSPIVISIHDSVPTVTPLLECNPTGKNERVTTRVKIESTPLVDGLGLYRYEPAYRYPT